MADYQGVAVYGETKESALAPLTTEGLGIGRQLADALGQELSCVLVGGSVGGLVEAAIAAGADKVYVVADPGLADYQTDAYVGVMERVVQQARPAVIILGQSDTGRDLAPRLAFRLGTAATLDCTDLEIDAASKRLLATKPVYGGNALAVYTSQTDPQIVTIRTKSFAPLVPDTSRQGEVINIAAELDEAAVRTKVIDRVTEEVAGVKIEDAAVVVAGGRGMGSAEGFVQLEELAKLFKGAVGASRPPCDNGWMPETVQVGLTGKIIAPELYIAVAISGSSQHMSGCSGAKTIVAINKDAEANIFRHARFGVVGDWKKVLPTFTAKVRELLAT